MIKNPYNILNRVVTIEQAYTIGFIAAKIYANSGSIDNGILRLVHDDRMVLENIQERLYCKKDTIFFKIKNGFILELPYCSLCNNLKRYGVFSNKIVPPCFKQKNLILSYICGLYDGGGYLSWIKKGKYHQSDYYAWAMTMVGNYTIMVWVAKQLEKFDIVEYKEPKKNKENKKQLYCLKFSNQTDINSIIISLRRLGVHLIKRKWYVKDYNKHRGIICVSNESKFYNF